MSGILFVLLALLVPASLVWVTNRFAMAERIGIIVLCYLAGMLLGNSGWLPPELSSVQAGLTDITIALALPLLLFTLDVRQWRHTAGKALLSMGLAITAVVTLATCMFFLLRGDDPLARSHLAAMSVGVYTGGTPNLAAIKTGLNIPGADYLIFHSLDTLAGSVYLLAMLTVGIRVFRGLLGSGHNAATDRESATVPGHTMEDLRPLLAIGALPQIGAALALALAVVGAAWLLSTGAAHFFGMQGSTAVMIIMLTTLGILLSLSSRIRSLTSAYRLGTYLIYVFCFVVASMASLEQLARVDAVVALFLCATITGSVVLHALACRALGVDGDTFMVTSVAAVCSPPFVPMMARALGNPSTILTGMTTGILGYALGNYLGISLGLLLRNL